MHKSAKVLVIEDHDDTRFLTLHHLNNLGVTVIEAVDALSALEHLGRGVCPDLILLDLKLGDTKGEDLVKKIRVFPSCTTTKIVVMSASADLEKRSKELGAVDWIQKPASRADIQTVVVRHLKDFFTSAL